MASTAGSAGAACAFRRGVRSGQAATSERLTSIPEILEILGATLTSAAAIAIGLVPIIAVILMLMSPRATKPGCAILIGWLVVTAVVRVPIRIASIESRWAVNGDHDLATVHALQDARVLTPLDPTAVPHGLPIPAPGTTQAETFQAKYSEWNSEVPLGPRDSDLLASGGGNAAVNEWNLTYHPFDDSLDFFQVGSHDLARNPH